MFPLPSILRFCTILWIIKMPGLRWHEYRRQFVLTYPFIRFPILSKSQSAGVPRTVEVISHSPSSSLYTVFHECTFMRWAVTRGERIDSCPPPPTFPSLCQKGCGLGWRRQPPSIILCCDTWLVAPEPLGVMSLLAATQKPERSSDLLCSTFFISSAPRLPTHCFPVFVCASGLV